MGDMASGKRCKKCHKMKLITAFDRDRHYHDGYRDVCRECADPRRRTRKGKKAFNDHDASGSQWG